MTSLKQSFTRSGAIAMIQAKFAATFKVRTNAGALQVFAALLIFASHSSLLSASQFAAEEAVLDQARASEAVGNLPAAIETYQNFLSANPDSTFKNRVMTRMSVLREAERHHAKTAADASADEALKLYLSALDARNVRDIAGAEELLENLLAEHSGSYLHDDALYLKGYIAMMDGYRYSDAEIMFKELRNRFPDSSYIDTAMYSEAICLEQTGNTEAASNVFKMLRERHTEFSLSLFGVYWPKSTYLSRYWFDRADNRLDLIAERADKAARMVGARTISDKDAVNAGYHLRVEVAIEGRRLPLLLSSSSVISDTEFDSEAELTLALSDAKYYSGIVEGDPESWVRVMIRGQEIRGIVETGGERMDLEPASMVGTLEYYKPRDGKPGSIDELMLQDYVMQPPPEPQARNSDGSRDGLQIGKYQYPPADTDGAEPSLGAAVAGGVNRLVRMNVFVDSQYNDYYGGDGLLQAMSALNVADGIYRQNFGLAIEVGNAAVFTDRATDPMNLGPVTLESTLRRFRDYHLQTRSMNDDIGLTYLFSGNDNTDEAIGLAWIGAICRNDGFDVGVTTPSSYADLLVTHEIGHSLGAQHDSDTACSGSRNLLMWPRISKTTTQGFSNCSQNSVTSGIGKSCLLNTIDVSLDIQPLQNGVVRASLTNNDVRSTAHNASLVVEATAVDLNQLPAGCFESSPAELLCKVSSISPGESVEFDFGVGSFGNSTLVARVEAGGYYDVTSTNDQARLTLDAATGAVVAQQNSLSEDTQANTILVADSSDLDASGNGDAVSGGGGAADLWLLVGTVLSGLWLRSFAVDI